MQTVTVTPPGHKYCIAIDKQLFDTAASRELLEPVVRDRTCLLVSDSNVAPLYAAAVTAAAEEAGASHVLTVSFPAGEQSKQIATLIDLYRGAVQAGLDRTARILAVGGGVTGDIAGFVAATYMRGIPFVQIPTSLLAMVDSSVGGKVGVDLPEGKNLVGAFHQPELVLTSLSVLETLPARELACGLAEIVKTAVILDAGLFDTLEREQARLNHDHLAAFEPVIARCCELKAEVVAEDEREHGRRAILNYGHTFGHALETLGSYSALNHGEAVAVGMGMAADLAVATRRCPPELPKRQDALLDAFHLPTHCELPGISVDDVLAAMKRDKKVRRGALRLILPDGLGRVSITPFEDESALRQAIGGRLG